MLDALGVLVARPMSAIKTVQYGTVTVANGALSGTATITAVTIGKSVLIPLGWNSTAAGVNTSNYPRMTLTNSTTVTAITAVAMETGANVISGFVVVEFW